MMLLDERILELLRVGGPLSPRKLATDDRVPWKPRHVGERCRRLTAYGLVRHVGNGVYAIAEDGQRYLDDDLDATTLVADGRLPDERTTPDSKPNDGATTTGE